MIQFVENSVTRFLILTKSNDIPEIIFKNQITINLLKVARTKN